MEKIYLGEFRIDSNILPPNIFSKLLDITNAFSITVTDFNKTAFRPSVLPSTAKYLKSFKWVSFVTVMSFMYVYVDSDDTEQTVNVTYPSSDFLTSFMPYVQTFFSSSEFKQLCKVIIDSSTDDLKNSIYEMFKQENYVYPNENAIFLYVMNSSKNTVNKSLTFVGNMYINYNKPISYKQLTVDLELTTKGLEFNYVYLTVLNRYYYVTDCIMMKNYYSITLNEDVLMTWKNLIYSQSAIIERTQSDLYYDLDKVDNLVTYDYDKEITIQTVTDSLNLFEIPSGTGENARYVLNVVASFL